MADLTRMTAPNGATVRVSAERAKVLAEQGYKAVADKKASAKSTSSKSSK